MFEKEIDTFENRVAYSPTALKQETLTSEHSEFQYVEKSETIQQKLLRLTRFWGSFSCVSGRPLLSRLQIFKSNKTETFLKLQFWILLDRDFPRVCEIVEPETFLRHLLISVSNLFYLQLNLWTYLMSTNFIRQFL